MKIVQSEALETTSFASKPGKYHVMVNKFIENPPDKDDRPQEGACKIECEILAGTEPSEVNKTFTSMFFAGRPEDKDQGRFANLKLTRLFVALGGPHKPGEETELTEDNASGRQMVLELNHRENKGKKYFDIVGANIYHVDDPAVASVPKNDEYLDIIDESLRLKKSDNPEGESGAGALVPNNPSSNPPASAAKELVGAGVGAGETEAVDLDDI